MTNIESILARRTTLKELLVDFLEAYFKANQTSPDWRGTRTHIMQVLFENPLNAPLLRGLKTFEMDESLQELQREGFFKLKWEHNYLRHVLWVFSNPEYVAPVAETTPEPLSVVAPATDCLAERKLALAERQASIAERQITLSEQQLEGRTSRAELALKKERRLFERDAAKRLLRLNSPTVLEAAAKAKEAQEYAEKAERENPMVGDLLPWTDKGAVIYNEAWYVSRIGLLTNQLHARHLEIKRLEAIIEAGGLQS